MVASLELEFPIKVKWHLRPLERIELEPRHETLSGGPRGKTGPDGRLYAADDLAVEDFDRFDNLMIAEALLASGAKLVIHETEPADVWRDTRAFEQSLIVIKESVAASTRLVVAR